MNFKPPYMQYQCPGTIPQFHLYAWCQSCRWCMSSKKRIAGLALEQFQENSRHYRAWVTKESPVAHRRPSIPGAWFGGGGVRSGERVVYSDADPGFLRGRYGVVKKLAPMFGDDFAWVNFDELQGPVLVKVESLSRSTGGMGEDRLVYPMQDE